MNYKTTKIEIDGQIVEVPEFRVKETKQEAWYCKERFVSGKLFGCQTVWEKEDVELIPIWHPKQGERVLFTYSNGCVYIGDFEKQKESSFYVWTGGQVNLSNAVAKYDPSKPIPESWAEVERTGEVLRV